MKSKKISKLLRMKDKRRTGFLRASLSLAEGRPGFRCPNF
jgi:hypothetical protein